MHSKVCFVASTNNNFKVYFITFVTYIYSNCSAANFIGKAALICKESLKFLEILVARKDLESGLFSQETCHSQISSFKKTTEFLKPRYFKPLSLQTIMISGFAGAL